MNNQLSQCWRRTGEEEEKSASFNREKNDKSTQKYRIRKNKISCNESMIIIHPQHKDSKILITTTKNVKHIQKNL